MDIVYRRGEATVGEVLAELPDPPSESAVRSALWLLKGKGLLRLRQEGPRNVYAPAIPTPQVRRSAVKHLLSTFFQGSRSAAVAAILGDGSAKLSDEEIGEIEQLLARARARK